MNNLKIIAQSEQTCAQTNNLLVGVEGIVLSTVQWKTCIGIWEDHLPRLNTDFDWFYGGLPKSGLRERSWKPSGRYAARGFESHILLRVHTLRQKLISSWFNDFWCLYIRATTACDACKRIAKVLRAFALRIHRETCRWLCPQVASGELQKSSFVVVWKGLR